MTMQQMNEYLEKRGFEVERAYLKDLGVYRFVIKKNGNLLGASFKYPETNDWHYKNERMQEFLEKIVRDFEVKFMDMDKENPHVYISTARHNGKSLFNEELWKAYVNADNEMTKNIYKRMVNSMYGSGKGICKPYVDPMEIKDVIFNNPATIVFWADGTKTVVKCQEGDEFDPEKGLTMAIVKKVYGNKGSYCNVIKKWCEPYYEKQAEEEIQTHEFTIELEGGTLCKNLKDLFGPINTGEVKFTFTGTRVNEERDTE